MKANEQKRDRQAGVAKPATHQESRDHNKHNRQEQGGHKPQQHNPAEEKH